MKKFLMGAGIVVVLLALVAGVGGLVLGGLAYKTAFETQAVNDVNIEVQTDLSEVAGYTPDTEAGERVVELKSELQGGNTKLIWETGKVQGGQRYDFDGTWTSLGGAVVYDPKAKALKALEVVIVIESFNSYGSESPAPGGLINTVIGKGTPPPTGFDPWFNIEDHPDATFAATEFVAKAQGVGTDYDNAPEGWTHLIKGTFDLNGTEKQLELPAVVAFDGDTLRIDTAFAISREAFKVAPKKPLPGSEVDDLIQITASVTAEPDAGLAVGALAEMINAQGTQIAALKATNENLNTQLALIKDAIAALERKVAAGVSAGPAVDVASLPKTFTDKVAYPGKDPIDLEMVLVPGEGEVKPFYMAKHEVTWDMFYSWAYGVGLDANEYASLQKKDLRPSPLYEDCEQLKLGLGKRPAVSMSRTTAEAYAKWLTAQTGRNYRLPTDAEWQTALKLGGGIPDSKDELLSQAVLKNNAEEQFEPPFLWLTAEVGSKKPNALGIHDMLGNAAEWVVDTGAQRIVRGGHFRLDVDEEPLTKDWKAVASQEIWNETYPNEPKSRFWYRDHYYQGIRLVCDVE
ncbi:MAG: SUMF1/EgtB/PvdO family nonheme iron enzyme [Phycisphaeraceae bacterium]